MSKVVSLSDYKKKREQEHLTVKCDTDETEVEESFEEVEERNRKNKERVEKERLAKNKSVLRSHRIKD